jgi:hypothetical protein
MKELHALVDYENVQPSLEALAKLAPGFTDVWLFYGPHQAKQAQAFSGSNERVTLVPRSGKGLNALDFHLSFYLGYVAAKHPNAELVVVANDSGYDPMLAHARMLKFRARRVGYKAPVAKKAVVAKPVATASVPVVTKKAAAKKTVAPMVVAKQATPKPAAPAKTVAINKSKVSATPVQSSIAASANRIGVKVTVAKTKQARVLPAKTLPPVRKTAAKPAASALPDAKLLARITKGLAKMGDKAPTKPKSFLNALKPMLDKNSTGADAEAMLQKLQDKGVVRVQGAVVSYPK